MRSERFLPIRTSTVFRSDTDGYAFTRIPAIVAANDGTLLAFAEGRLDSPHDHGNVELILRRSHDDGATWGEVQVVASDRPHFVGNPSPVVDRSTGRVILLALRKHGNDNEIDIDLGRSTDTCRVWITTSDDAGATWAPPIEITASAKHHDWRWYTIGPGHAIQLEHGPLRGRLVAAANHFLADVGLGANAIFSDDGGTTWSLGGADTTELASDRWPDENTAAELPDGRIVFLCRNQQGQAEWHRLRTTSSDGGSTFDTPFVSVPDLTVPIVQGSLLWDGGIEGRLLFSAPTSPTDRVDLAVRSSADAGISWQHEATVAQGPAGYSDLVSLPHGNIGVLHEAGDEHSIERIDFTVLTPLT